MDRILKYQKAVIDLLEEYRKRYQQSPTLQPEHYVISDKENHHYQLIEMGFEDGVFVHRCIFHFDIINEKVWLQVNETDVLIADRLMEYGVPKESIVIGFQQPHLRKYTGFAVA
ncbi:MAG: XisI protein [Bacteroidota bacterium]